MTGERASAKDFEQPKLEALIEMMYLAAHADGEFSDEERVQFAKSVQSLTDRRIEDLGGLLAKIEQQSGSQPRDAHLASLKERLGDAASRKIALDLAVQVMASDGIIRTSERELIMDIADVLEIDRDEAADLVKSVSP